MSNISSPIQHATSVHLDSEDDDPRQARTELLNLIQHFNALLDRLGSAAFKNIGNNEGEVVALAQGGILPQALRPSSAALPTGTLLDFFRSTAPTGWLAADGQTISNQNADHQDLYSLLFQLASESSSTVAANLFASTQDQQAAATKESVEEAWADGIAMKVPDLRGRSKVALGKGSGINLRHLGESLGAETVTLEKSHLPSVRLSISHPSYTGGKRTVHERRFELVNANNRNVSYSRTIIDNKTELMGESVAHDNMPPSFGVLTCIKY